MISKRWTNTSSETMVGTYILSMTASTNTSLLAIVTSVASNPIGGNGLYYSIYNTPSSVMLYTNNSGSPYSLVLSFSYRLLPG